MKFILELNLRQITILQKLLDTAIKTQQIDGIDIHSESKQKLLARDLRNIRNQLI